MRHRVALSLVVLGLSLFADEPAKEPLSAPRVDRVGFPQSYAQKFTVLRVVKKPAEHKVVTIYGNESASTITNTAQLPYPNGSVIVMETASVLQDPQGEVLVDSSGNLRKKEVLG